MTSITINADIGEGYGGLKMGDDEAMLELVQAVNIACGKHGGDPSIMDRLVRLAKARGISIGAHPGFDDLWGMGRRPIEMEYNELSALIIYQIGALQAICRRHDAKLSHVKAHGALYNMAAVRPDYADALCHAVRSAAGDVILVGLPDCEMSKAASTFGIVYAKEAFADRAYDKTGMLAPRTMEGAVLTDPNVIAARAIAMVNSGEVSAITGEPVSVACDTLCVHGDTPEAVTNARAIDAKFQSAGIDRVPF